MSLSQSQGHPRGKALLPPQGTQSKALRGEESASRPPEEQSAETRIQDEDERLLETAATETCDRIRRHGQAASHRVQMILAHIENHLFDPKLSVKRIREKCQIRDSSVLTLFHRELGRPPYGYIVDCRMAVAQELLRTTNLQIWKISSLLGYGSLPTFSHAFLKWSSMRPRAFRERTRNLATGSDPEQQATLTQTTLSDCLRRARERFFAELRPGKGGAPLRIDGKVFEVLAAEEIWSLIEGLPEEQQKTLVRERIRFRSTALFELLHQKSRAEGLNDRSRAVSLAKLALESLHGSSDAFSNSLPSLEARAWAWIGNAQRLAMDFPAAEQSFDRAEAIWQLGDSSTYPTVPAEIFQNKAALRWFERRFPEALSLVEKAIAIQRTHGKPGDLLRLTVLKSNILLFANQLTAAKGALRLALAIEDKEADVYLSVATYSTLTNIHLVEGDSQAAANSLETFKEMAGRLANPIPDCHIQWVESLVCEALGHFARAEELLEQALEGFDQRQESLMAAAVALDLALFCHRQKRPEDTTRHALRAQALFKSLRIDREALMSANLLSDALQQQDTMLSVLQRLRQQLASLTLMPSFSDKCSPSD